MTVAQTSNKGLFTITVGTESGTWGPYVNNSANILDDSLGGTATISLSNSNVILSSAQYQCNFLTFTGTLGANVTVTLPAAGSFHTIQNLVTNPTQFSISLNTAGAGERIGVPWGDATDIITDGSNVKFRSLGRVGTYLDVASQSIPNWIAACTVPPYLYCNGATFSSATYPVLRDFLGANTLPDCRGRTRFSLNDGTARVNSSLGLNGNTLLAGGGYDSVVLALSELPWAVSANLSDGFTLDGPDTTNRYGINKTPVSPVLSISNRPPAIVAGFTMIRAG